MSQDAYVWRASAARHLDREGYHGTATLLRDALLSEPTPTAEHHDLCATRIPGTGTPGLEGVPQPCNCHRFLPEPPNIADMVPGTTFTAEGNGVPGTPHRFEVRDVTHSTGVRYLRCLTHDGNGAIASYVDPSTIRDVTPPKGGAGGG